MRIVAIECSSPRHSVALLDDDRVVLEKSWDTTPRGGQRVFERLEEILSDAEITARDVDLWVAGSGPGNFSGMRVSMAAVKAFGLALDTRIEAVSSGEALAHAWMEEGHGDAVTVVGDARRGHLWFGCCLRDGATIKVDQGWALCDYVDFPRRINNQWPCLSSEAERVQGALDKAAIEGVELSIARFPLASSLGQLAYARVRGDLPFEPMIPHYMHEAI